MEKPTYIAKIKDEPEWKDGGEIEVQALWGLPVVVDPTMPPGEIHVVPFPGSMDDRAARLEATRRRLPPGCEIVKERGQHYIKSGGIIIGRVDEAPLAERKPPDMSPLMRALFDLASLSPSVSWRIEEKGYGTFTLYCWRGARNFYVKLRKDQAWAYPMEDWRAAIMEAIEGRDPPGFGGFILGTVE